MRVLTKALSGHKPTCVPESLEEASKDVSNLRKDRGVCPDPGGCGA